MFRFQVVGAVALTLVAAMLLPTALHGTAQAAGEGFATIGEDPAGDSTNDIAPGADADAVVTSDRTDILSVDLKLDADALLVRMAIGATPTGTSGYMYDVYFDVAGETYFTCFNAQWFAGTQSVENIKGCSRFTEGTQVGPGTTADGVIVDGEAPGFVTWAVPLADIGAVAGDALDNVVAETWFRGASDCCVGSSTDAQYLWNRADVAPDEGVWTATIGAGGDGPAPLPDLVLEDVVAPAFVTEGAPFTVNGTIALDGPVADNMTYPLAAFVSGAAWNNTTGPDPIGLGTNLTRANLTLTVEVPAGTADTEVELTWRVCHADLPEPDNNTTLPACGETTFTVSVFAASTDEPEAEAAPAETEPSANGNGTGNSTASAEEESLPAPGLAIGAVLTVALAAWYRRRP